MANPRKILSMEQTDDPVRSFFIDNATIIFDATQPNGAAATMIGKAVSLSGDLTVQLCSDGDAVVGKLMNVEPDGVCAVWLDGAVPLPAGNGATVTRGSKIVGALGAASARGYIRNVASATAAELAVARGQILSIADTTAVVVEF